MKKNKKEKIKCKKILMNPNDRKRNTNYKNKREG